jgi:DNA-binding transcriptional ArsR family regulator
MMNLVTTIEDIELNFEDTSLSNTSRLRLLEDLPAWGNDEMIKTDTGIDMDIVKALAHPARFHALDILNKRVASPKELAAEVGIEVGLMSYHVKQLRDKGFVELVDTVPRRGAVEHFYRASKRAMFSDAEWPRVPANIRGSIVGEQIERTGALLGAALDSGSFEARPTRHHSLCESLIDEQGWKDSMEALKTALERLIEIEGESAERRLASEEPGIPMAVLLAGFEKADAP